ncbi:RNA 2'-phosphotransferase [Shouchella miscanthi]|uniref:RNA 2'-phosphotransferase n=1 Tax=Shouchella miscanthi TaxID=2598861 RepID=A0ABU6NR47_9BACI|nr:RNA 2'-phosphotransferase [Shouchella miscanthi]MED4130662.1 RNA 2'-phosphotransferase [Shouchella miscanthi]
MSENELNKFLSLILRHTPEKIGLKLDESGYVNVNDPIHFTRYLTELEESFPCLVR